MSIDPALIDWYEWDDDMGDAGLPGTGVTSGQLLDITTRLTDAEADIDAAEAELATVPTFDLTGITSGQLLQWDGTKLIPYTNTKTVTISMPWSIDGGGAAITPHLAYGFHVEFACTITGWAMLANVSGNIVIGVWVDTNSNAPPTIADEKFTMNLTGAQKNSNSAITPVAVAGNSWIYFNVGSASTLSHVDFSLKATRTI